MELVLIDPNSSEWQYMWEWLANHPLNKGIENPKIAEYEGEAWQYMGSFKQGEKVIHEFRHRIHPVTQSRQNVKVEASENFTPNQITKTYKL